MSGSLIGDREIRMPQNAPDGIPTRTSAAIFLFKASLLRVQRAIQNWRHSIPRHPQMVDERFRILLAESLTNLWTDTAPTEAWYQRGKIENLRLAARRLHQCVIPAGDVFSFWRQVGRASGYKGYVLGRMLQEGCMIPAVGGGLCQLSNALYQVALDSGCEILERHPHSRVVPGSATAARRDATVAWNYIDLRFCSRQPMQLDVRLTATHLKVSMSGTAHHGSVTIIPSDANPQLKTIGLKALPIFNDHACESCGQVACFRSDHKAHQAGSSPVTAFLLDAAWPEFVRYVKEKHTGADRLAIPIDGKRWNRPQYAWPTENFSAVDSASVTTLLRAVRSRRLATQGALRQRAFLEGARALADQLAKSLDANVDEVCVSQTLLPFLWKSGVLGGRRVTVLCYQLPASILHDELNRASLAHPESGTLNDFRAEQWILNAEDEALQAADRVITPNAYIAALFPAKSTLLEWATPSTPHPLRRPPGAEPPTVLFPCATLGRKGAYELREALRGMDARLVLGGKILEHQDFWSGFNIVADWNRTFDEVDVVVQPSIVESQPRTLLRALAANVPVITTPNSGLHPRCHATFVPPLDVEALRQAIAEPVPFQN